MTNNSISIDIDDPRTSLIAEALANKTCVKILNLLAEKELTAGDIANSLKIPLNTTGYNLEKLISAGLIEKSSNFFWSVKGKKTPTYRVANKKIVISPKRLIRGVVPAVLISGIASFILKQFTSPVISKQVISEDIQVAQRFAEDSASISIPEIASVVSNNASSGSGIEGWFFIGALFSLIILFLWEFIMSNTSRFK